MDPHNQTSETIQSNQEIAEEKILSFIKNFKATKPTYAPVFICNITQDMYMNLFNENDGKCGAKLYFKNNSLYLLDSLSFLHGQILGFVSNSIHEKNLYLKYYFNYGSYSKLIFYYIFFSCLF